MSREQRTRLNIMISEQTGAAANQAPGRKSLSEELDGEQDQEQESAQEQEQAQEHAQEQVVAAERKRSIFDLPYTADVPSSGDDE